MSDRSECTFGLRARHMQLDATRTWKLHSRSFLIHMYNVTVTTHFPVCLPLAALKTSTRFLLSTNIFHLRFCSYSFHTRFHLQSSVNQPLSPAKATHHSLSSRHRLHIGTMQFKKIAVAAAGMIATVHARAVQQGTFFTNKMPFSFTDIFKTT